MFVEVTLYDKFRLDEKIIINTNSIETIERDGGENNNDSRITMVSGDIYRTLNNYNELLEKII